MLLMRYCRNAFCRPLRGDGNDFIELSYPGTANLVSTIRGDMNDKVLSYHCLASGSGDGMGRGV
jgi:hypothetical protein